MPELPEVETICRELETALTGKRIDSIESLREKTIITNSELISHQLITSVKRRAKYIIISLDQGQKLLIHLKMTGKLIYPAVQNQINKYTRAVFYLDDSMIMLFDDVRTFGKIQICYNEYAEQFFSKAGIEPLSEDFKPEYLMVKAQKRHTAVKIFLMDQSVVVGIGNIYAQELLFKAGISPERDVSQISGKEWSLIIKATVEILNTAIANNGTTISDFRRVDDKTGEFQNFLQVYGKEKCPLCHQSLKLIRQAGRSTRYCVNCQR